MLLAPAQPARRRRFLLLLLLLRFKGLLLLVLPLLCGLLLHLHWLLLAGLLAKARRPRRFCMESGRKVGGRERGDAGRLQTQNQHLRRHLSTPSAPAPKAAPTCRRPCRGGARHCGSREGAPRQPRRRRQPQPVRRPARAARAAAAGRRSASRAVQGAGGAAWRAARRAHICIL